MAVIFNQYWDIISIDELRKIMDARMVDLYEGPESFVLGKYL